MAQRGEAFYIPATISSTASAAPSGHHAQHSPGVGSIAVGIESAYDCRADRAFEISISMQHGQHHPGRVVDRMDGVIAGILFEQAFPCNHPVIYALMHGKHLPDGLRLAAVRRDLGKTNPDDFPISLLTNAQAMQAAMNMAL